MDTKKTLIVVGSLIALAGASYGVYYLVSKNAKPSSADVDAMIKAADDARKRGSKMDVLEGLSTERKIKFLEAAKKSITKKEAKSVVKFFEKYGTAKEQDIPASELSNLTKVLGKIKIS